MVSHAQSTKTRKEYILIKGAPEVVARIIGQKAFLEEVAKQQERGRRAIAAAVIEGELDYEVVKQKLNKGETLKDWRYIGTWFIEDPVRGDVPEYFVSVPKEISNTDNSIVYFKNSSCINV